MTADPVFGPLRTSGINTCPDCRARGGTPCTGNCPRRQFPCICDCVCPCEGTGWEGKCGCCANDEHNASCGAAS